MVDVRPFRAVRYDRAVVGDLVAATAPAIDDVSRYTYARRRTASPYTVLELLAPQPDGSYTYAADVMRRWHRTGVLVTDDQPAMYRYEEHHLHGGVPFVQRGFCVELTVAPFGPVSGVLPHEHTDDLRVADRLARLDAVPIDVSPVFGLYRNGPGHLRELLDVTPSEPPIVAITDVDGVDHRVWRLDPRTTASVRSSFSEVDVVIADGHHRYATALARAERNGLRAGHTLAYLVDADVHGPDLQPVHRLLRQPPADLLDRISRDFALEPVEASPARLAVLVADAGDHRWGLYHAAGDGATAYLMTPHRWPDLVARTPSNRSASWRDLDTAVLHYAVLPATGVDSADVEARSDLNAAAAQITDDAAIVVLPPVTTAGVLDLAARGELMPAKSTSFHPKPRTGLIMRDAAES